MTSPMTQDDARSVRDILWESYVDKVRAAMRERLAEALGAPCADITITWGTMLDSELAPQSVNVCGVAAQRLIVRLLNKRTPTDG